MSLCLEIENLESVITYFNFLKAKLSKFYYYRRSQQGNLYLRPRNKSTGIISIGSLI